MQWQKTPLPPPVPAPLLPGGPGLFRALPQVHRGGRALPVAWFDGPQTELVVWGYESGTRAE